jgi:hypothetical protein
MNPIMFLKKVATSVVLVVVVAACGATSSGCAYGGVASTPDGTVIIARNGMLGAARKVFVCKVVGNALTCTESPSAP